MFFGTKNNANLFLKIQKKISQYFSSFPFLLRARDVYGTLLNYFYSLDKLHSIERQVLLAI